MRHSALVVGLCLALAVVSAGSSKIIYVDDDANAPGDGKSWATAYRYLQDALADAKTADKPVEIRVAQGVYKPDQGANQKLGDRSASFYLMNGLSLLGGYAGIGVPDSNAPDIELYETVLSGDLLGNDAMVKDPCDLLADLTRSENSLTVVRSLVNDSTAVLNGFTVSGGCYNVLFPDDLGSGAGMDIAGGTPRVVRCTFRNNSTTRNGGGMRNAPYSRADPGGSPTLIGCVFIGNSARSSGGGMSSIGSPTLVDCMFKGNFGGGMSGGAQSKLTNCVFEGNVGGGMHCGVGSPVLTGCRFIGNVGDEGAGMNIYLGSPMIRNCVFAKNSASSGNAVACEFAYKNDPPNKVTITNCILWDGGNEVSASDTSLVVITYSDIQGGWPPPTQGRGSRRAIVRSGIEGEPGTGNFNGDPLFADPTEGDYHLKSQGGRWEAKSRTWVVDDVTSPCVDRGDPNSPIGSEPFPNGGRVNMGAYGGTAEASKSYYGKAPCAEVVAGDIDGDCQVNLRDLVILASHWLE